MLSARNNWASDSDPGICQRDDGCARVFRELQFFTEATEFIAAWNQMRFDSHPLVTHALDIVPLGELVVSMTLLLDSSSVFLTMLNGLYTQIGNVLDHGLPAILSEI